MTSIEERVEGAIVAVSGVIMLAMFLFGAYLALSSNASDPESMGEMANECHYDSILRGYRCPL